MGFLSVLAGLIVEFGAGFLLDLSFEKLGDGLWPILGVVLAVCLISLGLMLLGSVAGWMVILGVLAFMAGGIFQNIRR